MMRAMVYGVAQVRSVRKAPLDVGQAGRASLGLDRPQARSQGRRRSRRRTAGTPTMPARSAKAEIQLTSGRDSPPKRRKSSASRQQPGRHGPVAP